MDIVVSGVKILDSQKDGVLNKIIRKMFKLKGHVIIHLGVLYVLHQEIKESKRRSIGHIKN